MKKVLSTIIVMFVGILFTATIYAATDFKGQPAGVFLVKNGKSVWVDFRIQKDGKDRQRINNYLTVTKAMDKDGFKTAKYWEPIPKAYVFITTDYNENGKEGPLMIRVDYLVTESKSVRLLESSRFTKGWQIEVMGHVLEAVNKFLLKVK
jgi:uncharacterized protein YxeA